MQFESRPDEGSGGGSEKDTAQALKERLKDISPEMEEMIEYLNGDNAEDEYRRGRLLLSRLLDTEVYTSMRTPVEESGLKWNKYGGKDYSTGEERCSSLEELESFFKDNNISAPEHKVSVIVLAMGKDVLDAEALESKKYQPFTEEELDPKNSRIGRLLTSLSLKPEDYLKEIEDAPHDRHSYSRVNLEFKTGKLATAVLMYFMEKGDGATKQEIEDLVKKLSEEGKEGAKKTKIEKEKQEQERQEKINKITGGIEVSPTTMKIIEENLSPWDGGIKTVDKDTVIVWNGRQSYSGGSGVAMYSDLSVYLNGNKQTQSFQYRDAYSANRDDFSRRITGVSDASVETSDDNIVIVVETKNGLSQRFEFDKDVLGEVETTELSIEEQKVFEEKFNVITKELMDKYNVWWESTPAIPAPNGTRRYLMPRIVAQETVPKYGIGIIQIERQIDARSYENPQMMNHLIFVDKEGNSVEIAENHGYKSEGKGQLSLVGIDKVGGKIEYSIDGETKVYKI